MAALTTLRDEEEDSGQAVSVLRAAIANDRVVFRVPGGHFVAVSPDGSLLATTDWIDDEVAGVAVWNIASGEVVERYARPDDMDPGTGWHAAAFSHDGNLLAVSFEEAEPPVTVWNRTTGESFHIGTDPGAFTSGLAFSPDGELLAFNSDQEGELERGVEVWSMSERRRVYQTNQFGQGPGFNTDGLMSYGVDAAVSETGGSSVRVVDPATGELINTFPVDLDELYFTRWSPAETQVAAGNQDILIVLDVATGDEVSRTTGRLFRPEWLTSSDAFVVGGELNPRVIGVATGAVRTELLGLTGGTWEYYVVPGTTLLASASLFGDETVIFDTSQLGSTELGGWVAPIGTATVDYTSDGERVIVSDLFTTYLTAGALNGNEARLHEPGPGDPRVEVNANGSFIGSQGPDGIWRVRTADTDTVIYTAPEGMVIRGVSLDGDQVLINPDPDQLGEDEECDPSVVSTVDGSIVALAEGDCARAFFSPDGRLVFTGTKAIFLGKGLFDTDSGELLAAIGDPIVGFEAAFTPDGRKLVSGSWGGSVFIIDVATLLSGASIDEAVTREIPAHDDSVLKVSVSPDGSMISSWAWSEPFKVWNLQTGRSLGQFGGMIDSGTYHGGDFHPSLPRLVVTTPPNEVRIHTLDIDELIAIAVAGLSRDITELECLQYLRRACDGS